MSREVQLDLAAFLDSPQARSLTGPGPGAVRGIAERFLGACYENLGKAPRLLDGEDVRTLLTEVLPGHLGTRDPLAEHVPAVLAAFFEHLQATQVVIQGFEIRQQLDACEAAFQECVRSGRLAQRYAARSEPVVHVAQKLGRNDPCSCGSGKKYKKCHGKGL